MLERMQELPGNVTGLSAKGKVVKTDYEQVVLPMVEEAKRSGRPLKVLYEFGTEFEGFTPGAIIEDARVALKNVSIVDRFAVVSDHKRVQRMMRAMQGVTPRPMRVFGNDERNAAINWLGRPAEHSGLDHRLLPELGVLMLRVRGSITVEDIEPIRQTVDDEIRRHGRLSGVVVQASCALRWATLGSFWSHLDFVRSHHRKVGRIALVSDRAYARIAPWIAGAVLAPEVRQFATDDLAVAVQWAGNAKTSHDPPRPEKAGGDGRGAARQPTPPAATHHGGA